MTNQIISNGWRPLGTSRSTDATQPASIPCPVLLPDASQTADGGGGPEDTSRTPGRSELRHARREQRRRDRAGLRVGGARRLAVKPAVTLLSTEAAHPEGHRPGLLALGAAAKNKAEELLSPGVMKVQALATKATGIASAADQQLTRAARVEQRMVKDPDGGAVSVADLRIKLQGKANQVHQQAAAGSRRHDRTNPTLRLLFYPALISEGLLSWFFLLQVANADTRYLFSLATVFASSLCLFLVLVLIIGSVVTADALNGTRGQDGKLHPRELDLLGRIALTLTALLYACQASYFALRLGGEVLAATDSPSTAFFTAVVFTAADLVLLVALLLASALNGSTDTARADRYARALRPHDRDVRRALDRAAKAGPKLVALLTKGELGGQDAISRAGWPYARIAQWADLARVRRGEATTPPLAVLPALNEPVGVVGYRDPAGLPLADERPLRLALATLQRLAAEHTHCGARGGNPPTPVAENTNDPAQLQQPTPAVLPPVPTTEITVTQ